MPAKAGAVIATIPEGEEDETIAIGSAEEAKSKEHLMTRLPNNPHCEVAPRQTSNADKEEHVVVIEPDTIPHEAPVKFGDQVTADNLIRNDDGVGDSGIRVDTVAVVLLDRGTKWIDVFPTASETTDHTTDAFQHFAGPKDKIARFF